MNLDQILLSLLGGGLIGIAVTLMLLFNGRVTGISGIIASSLSRPSPEGLWRRMFIIGLLVGGGVIRVLNPDFLSNTSDRSLILITIAGLLVGYGTVMGSGCTSGHGVCGISRFSARSILATLTFMLFGFLTVQIVHYFIGGSV